MELVFVYHVDGCLGLYGSACFKFLLYRYKWHYRDTTTFAGDCSALLKRLCRKFLASGDIWIETLISFKDAHYSKSVILYAVETSGAF